MMGAWGLSHDPDEVRLHDFQFRVNERFLHENDFTDQWRHQTRVETILDFNPRKDYPWCIGGKSVTDDGASKRFDFVHSYDEKPKRRVFEVLKS